MSLRRRRENRYDATCTRKPKGVSVISCFRCYYLSHLLFSRLLPMTHLLAVGSGQRLVIGCTSIICAYLTRRRTSPINLAVLAPLPNPPHPYPHPPQSSIFENKYDISVFIRTLSSPRVQIRGRRVDLVIWPNLRSTHFPNVYGACSRG